MNRGNRYLLDARAATPHFPGIGRYVRGLAGALPSLLAPEERLSLLAADDTPEIEIRDARVDRVPSTVSPFSLSQQWRLLPALAGAQVYHCAYYLMPYRPGVPTILTIYDLIPALFPRTVSLRARLLFSLATRMALRSAARVIAISAATRRDLLARFPRLDPDRIAAIPLAPDTRFRPQPPAEIARIRGLYGLPEEFCLYVGINKPHKNLTRLIKAWSGLPSAPPLAIAGAWDERYPESRRAAESLGPGRVLFLGRLPDEDLAGLYSACRLFVFPSLYEGFGLPVIEALACGAAVACSASSSLPEVAGEAAAYFDPQDPDAIRKAVAEALAAGPDPERSLRQAAKFSWAATAAATLEIYRSVAYNGP